VRKFYKMHIHQVHHRNPTPFFYYNNQRVFTPNARGMTKQKFPR
jgi:hypothetical protein